MQPTGPTPDGSTPGVVRAYREATLRGTGRIRSFFVPPPSHLAVTPTATATRFDTIPGRELLSRSLPQISPSPASRRYCRWPAHPEAWERCRAARVRASVEFSPGPRLLR